MPCTSSSWTTTSPSPPSSARNLLAASMALSLVAVLVSDWGSSSRTTSQPSTSSRRTMRFGMSSGYPTGMSENWLLRVAAEDLLEGGDHLALGGSGPGRFEKVRHEVLPVRRGRGLQRGEGALDGGRVAAGPGVPESIALPALNRRIRPVEVDSLVALEVVVVDADDDPPARVDLLLVAE